MGKENIRQLVGLKIKEIRKKRGLTQEQLAENVGLTGKFIGAVERGQNFASFVKLEEIAKTLDCDIRHFYEINYMDASDKELTQFINKRVRHLPSDKKRLILKLMDWIVN